MNDAAHREDRWSAGDAYEPYVGRWSRVVALEFLEWLSVPARARWLDAGCGTGALSETVLEHADPRAVVAVDAAEPFVHYAQGRLRDPRVEVRMGDAQALPCDDAAFDAAVAGLVLNFVPDPALAVTEMKRAVRPRGTVAAYVWDYAGEMQLMRRFWDAAVLLDPAAGDLDEARRFPICHPERLLALWQDAGLVNTAVRVIDIPTVFRDFDDYWMPFLGGQGPAPGYCAALSEADRGTLREHLRATLTPAADGTIPLKARAFAVRGARPT